MPAFMNCSESPERSKRLVGESAQPVARCHGAHKRALIGRIVNDTHPVAQQCAAARLGRRIDGDHPDRLAGLAPGRDQRRAQRGFADARRAGHADDMGFGLAPGDVEQRLCLIAFGIALQAGERGGECALAASTKR
jgi:hypothetical protein